VPQQFVRVWIEIDGTLAEGLACEGLPPKWFTKDPATTFESDLAEMNAVIRSASDLALALPKKPISFFEFWRQLVSGQAAAARLMRWPPLLASLGVSLIERAILDALCRHVERPLHELMRENSLGICLGGIHGELGNAQPADLLPGHPRDHAYIRHTIGLADPLAPADIPQAERVNDGLPQDLESSIREYGLRYFKVKLCGDESRDIPRLESIRAICDRQAGGEWRATFDGNENFKRFDAFRDFWRRVESNPRLGGLRDHVLLVEQPVHRDHALSDDAAAVLRGWIDRPPLIIDESDGSLGDVPQALDLGYDGASHKNCKGIVKGLANACLLERRRRAGRRAILTGEDLCNLGPVPLLQDLAMMALFGVEHIERNGHHYYRGLSMWPAPWQDAVYGAHPDLYDLRRGFPALHVEHGQISLASVNHAPFGCAPLLQ
jgi:hypothetical protein